MLSLAEPLAPSLAIPASTGPEPAAPSRTATARADAWAPVGAEGAQALCFAIEAEAETDVLCRLLGLFALHRVLPLDLQVRRQADRLQVRLLQDDLSRHRAEVIAEKIRSLVSVHGVAVQACDR